MALLLAHITYSQKNCGTIAPPPGEFEDWIQSIRLQPKNTALFEGSIQNTILTIPVVVHVLHKGEVVGNGTNISFERISQIQ